jgi:hypothetical protein
MKLLIKQNATSRKVKIFAQDSSSTTGAGLGSLVFNTASLTAYYIKEGDSSMTAISLVTATLGTWTSGGFIVVDGTNALGAYEIGIPNAALTALGSAFIYIKGATNLAPVVLEIQVVSFDPEDSVRMGLTALPNAAAGANGGLPLGDASGRVDLGKALGTAVTLDANNVLNVSTKYMGGTLLTARDIGLSVLLSSGTGTGQLNFTSGILKVDVETIKTNPVVNAGTITFPTGATLASTTNITALSGAALSTAGINAILDTVRATPVDGSIGSVPKYIPQAIAGAAGGLVICGSNAAATFATLTITGAFSINGTSNVAQTGDSFARIGTAGVGLTNLGDTRIANLDATVSSRSNLTQTQVTGGAYSMASASFAFGNSAAFDTVVPNIAFFTNAPSGGGGGSVVVTFSQAAAAIGATPADAGTITIRRGDTVSQALTGLGILTGRSKLWITAKSVPALQTDPISVIQVEETAGLVYLNRAAAATPTDASITVTNATTGAITVLVKAAASAQLIPGTYLYDVQVIIAGIVTTLAAGSFVVISDVTGAIS